MTFLYEWTGGLTSIMTFMYQWTGEMTSIINSLSLDWLVDLYQDLSISKYWCFDFISWPLYIKVLVFWLYIMTSIYQWTGVLTFIINYIYRWTGGLTSIMISLYQWTSIVTSLKQWPGFFISIMTSLYQCTRGLTSIMTFLYQCTGVLTFTSWPLYINGLVGWSLLWPLLAGCPLLWSLFINALVILTSLYTDKMWKLSARGQWNLVCLWRYWGQGRPCHQQARIHSPTPTAAGKYHPAHAWYINFVNGDFKKEHIILLFLTSVQNLCRIHDKSMMMQI